MTKTNTQPRAKPGTLLAFWAITIALSVLFWVWVLS